MIGRLLARLFGRKPRRAAPEPARPQPQPVSKQLPAAPPPPPPPPAPILESRSQSRATSAPQALEEPAATGAIRVVMEDGSVRDLEADPELAARARYLAGNLMSEAAGRPDAAQGGARPAPGTVRIVMDDGTVRDVSADPQLMERARYLARNLMPPQKPSDGPGSAHSA